MTVLPHLSDPHFGAEEPPVVEPLVALTRQPRPDLAVLSGDITQRARRACRRPIPNCKARSLLLPSVRVPQLASHLLGRLAQELPDQWQARCDARPLLL